MKHIFFLILIMVAFGSVLAQPSKKNIDNPQPKNGSVAMAQAFSNTSIENMNVYPNPVVDILKVSFKSNRSGIIGIALISTIGKRVYSKESAIEIGNNVISFDIRSHSIEPGIYFIQCVAENEVFTRKLIVK
ncbi:MAG: T9SS type A sorting domain-containing protein [Bacteroidales bacterium]